MIVCVAPNPSIDKLFVVERLEPGSIHRPCSFVQVPGGKGLNVARAAATLGADVRAVALLGGHSGRWIADELETLGLDTTAVWHSAQTRSCLSVADADAMTLTEFYENGLPVNENVWAEVVARVGEQAADASWVTVSGSLPPGVPSGGYAQLDLGENLAVDATRLGRAHPALVKVNAAEAADMTGSAIDSAEHALAAAHALRAQAGGDGHAVIVTLGRDGALLVDDAGVAWHGVVDASGPYPVGSGDAFLAGIVVALERGAQWPGALRAALGAGAANAELPGAGRLERGRAEHFAELARVHAL